MNCSEMQEALAGWLYGEVDATLAKVIESHLAECKVCRRELAGLKQTRRLLDAFETGPVQVDVGRIFRMEADRQKRRARRWRWAALASGAAAAAVLLIAIAARLEVRIEAHQLVLRWGEPLSVVEPPIVEPLVHKPPPDIMPALQNQIVTLTRLAQGLTETASDQAKKVKELSQLRDGVRDFERQAGRRMTSIERDVVALYAAVFGASRKGAAE